MIRCSMVMRVLPAVLGTVLLVGSAAADANADPDVGWNFNGIERLDAVFDSDHGGGRLDPTHLKGVVSIYDGTGLNAMEADPAGSSLGVRGAAANGTWFELNGSATGVVALSFAYRTTPTGFLESRVQVWNGTGWSDLRRFGQGRTTGKDGWSRVVVPLPEADGTVRIRILLDGSKGANGVIRFDNIVIGRPDSEPKSPDLAR